MPTRFTPEIALAHPIVSDARLSPDGAVVAFCVASATRPSGAARPALPPSAIWAVPAGGEHAAVRITHGRADSTPRWSPDGQRLAFLSDREQDGERQVYLLPRNGGEAARLTDVRGGIIAYRTLDPLAWFPDGQRLAFLLVDPETDAARARIGAGDDRIVFEEAPRFQRLWSVDRASGVVRAISPAGLQVWEFALSPDGTRVAAVVSDEPYEWAWYTARLMVFPVNAALTDARTVHDDWRQVAKPAWSADGTRIAFLTSNWSDRGYDNGAVMVVPADGSAGATFATGEDDDVSDTWIGFGDDGRILTATNVHAGAGVSSIDPSNGERAWLWQDRATAGPISAANLPGGGRRVATVLEDLETPAEVHVADIVDGRLEWRRLTDVHAPWHDVVLGETQERFWAGADGTPIQGFLFLPPGPRKGPLPLVTLVHGGPAGAVRFEYQYGPRWARVLADAGLAVLVPNYRGSTGWGLAYAEANIGDLGGGDFRDIMAGVDALITEGVADPDRLGICGWSYGGFMSSWSITQTDRFRAAVAGAAITEWRSFHGRSYLHTWDRLHFGDADPYDPDGPHVRFNPMTYIRRARTPTLILHGELDWDVPVEQGYILHRALRDLGVETHLVVYPREPHGPTEHAHRLDILRRVRDWFVVHLVDAGPPADGTAGPAATD